MSDPKIIKSSAGQTTNDPFLEAADLEVKVSEALAHLHASADYLNESFTTLNSLLDGSRATKAKLRLLGEKVADLNKKNEGLAGLLDAAEQRRRQAESEHAATKADVTLLLEQHANGSARIALLEGALSAVGVNLRDLMNSLAGPLQSISSLSVMFPSGAPVLTAITALLNLPKQISSILELFPNLDLVESSVAQPVVPGDGKDANMPAKQRDQDDRDDAHNSDLIRVLDRPYDARLGDAPEKEIIGAVTEDDTTLANPHIMSPSKPVVLRSLSVHGANAQDAYDYFMSVGTSEATNKADRLLEKLPDQETAQSVIEFLNAEYTNNSNIPGGLNRPVIMFIILAASTHKDRNGNYSLRALKGQIPTIYREVSEKYHYYRSGLVDGLGWNITDLTVDQANILDDVILPQLLQSYRLGRGDHIKADDKKIDKLVEVLKDEQAIQQIKLTETPAISNLTESAMEDFNEFEIGGLSSTRAIQKFRELYPDNPEFAEALQSRIGLIVDSDHAAAIMNHFQGMFDRNQTNELLQDPLIPYIVLSKVAMTNGEGELVLRQVLRGSEGYYKRYKDKSDYLLRLISEARIISRGGNISDSVKQKIMMELIRSSDSRIPEAKWVDGVLKVAGTQRGELDDSGHLEGTPGELPLALGSENGAEQVAPLSDADSVNGDRTTLIHSNYEVDPVPSVSLGGIKKFLQSYITHLKDSKLLVRSDIQIPLIGIISDLNSQVGTLLPYLEARIKLFLSSSSDSVIASWVRDKINDKTNKLGQAYILGNSKYASFLAFLSYFDGYQLEADARVGRKTEDVDNNDRLEKVFGLIKQLEETYSDQIADLDLFGLFRNTAIQRVVKRSHYSELLFVLEQIRNGSVVKSIPQNISRGKSCDFRIKHNDVTTLVEVKSLSSAEFDAALFGQHLGEAAEQLNSTLEKHSKKEIWFYLPTRFQHNHEQIARVISSFNQQHPKVEVILRLVDTLPEDINNLGQLFARVDEASQYKVTRERDVLVNKVKEILIKYRIHVDLNTDEKFEQNLVSGLSEVVVKVYDQVNYLMDDDIYNEIFDQFDSFQKDLSGLSPSEFNGQLAAAIDSIKKIEAFVAPSRESLLKDINNLAENKALSVVRVNRDMFSRGPIHQSSIGSMASGMTYVWSDSTKSSLKNAITQFKANFESMSGVPVPQFLSGIKHLGHSITLSPSIYDSISVSLGKQLTEQFKKAADLVTHYVNEILANNAVEDLHRDPVFTTLMSSQTLTEFESRMKLFMERPQNVTVAPNVSVEDIDEQLKSFYEAAYKWCARALTAFDPRAKMETDNINVLTNDNIKKAIVQPVLSLLDELLRSNSNTSESVNTKIRQLRLSIAEENIKNNWRKRRIREAHCVTLAKLLRLGVDIEGIRITDEMQSASRAYIQTLELQETRRGYGGSEAKIEISDGLTDYDFPVRGGEHLAGLPVFAMPLGGMSPLGIGARF